MWAALEGRAKGAGRLLSDTAAVIGKVVVQPWQTKMVLEPITQLLTAATEEERNRQTQAWKEAKLAELSFAGLTSALLSAVYVGAFTWPNPVIEENGLVRGALYGGLAIALAAITVAMQQAVALYRLSSNTAGNRQLRASLGYRHPVEGRRPKRLQMLLWQIPVMLLNVSIFMFMLSLAVVVWHGVRQDIERVETVVLFTLSVAFSIGFYLTSTVCMYAGMHSDSTETDI